MNGGAGAGFGMDVKFSAEHFGPLPHREQAEVTVFLGFLRKVSVKGASVVADFQMDDRCVDVETDPSLGSGGVFFDIVQGFLGDAVEGGSLLDVEYVVALDLAVQDEVEGNALAHLPDVAVQGPAEAELVDHGGPEIAGEFPDFGQRYQEVIAKLVQVLDDG